MNGQQNRLAADTSDSIAPYVGSHWWAQRGRCACATRWSEMQVQVVASPLTLRCLSPIGARPLSISAAVVSVHVGSCLCGWQYYPWDVIVKCTYHVDSVFELSLETFTQATQVVIRDINKAGLVELMSHLITLYFQLTCCQVADLITWQV